MTNKIIENKDLDLKLLCKLMYERMGYVTHYEIQLRTKSYINSYKTHDISDIDVYGYRFNSDLSFFTIGAECKSGETGALDEFFKFLGIVKYYELDRGYLIKTRIHQNARQVAIKNGFRCFTEAEIRQLLLGSYKDIDKQLKIENAKYQRVSKNLSDFRKKGEKLIEYLNLDYWNRENWKNIHNIIHILHAPLAMNLFEENRFTTKDKFVFYYTLELFSRSILKNISDSMILNYSDISSSLVDTLYGGAESLNEKRRIHDLVNQATSNNNPFEPEWQADLINICSRFAQSAEAASKIPEFIKDIYENAFYDIKIDINKNLIGKYPDLTRKFIQDLMQFLIKHCKISESIFDDFMKI